MWSQIQYAPAAGKRVVVEPSFVRSITVMKLRIDGKNLSQRTTLNKPAHALHCGYRTVRQVNSEQAVCAASGLDYSSRFKSVPSEWLLTKNCNALLERRDCLFRVKPVRCGNHNSVEVVAQQLIERREENYVRGKLLRFGGCFCVRVMNCYDFRNSCFHYRREAISANPTESDKPQPRFVRSRIDLYRCSAHKITNALMKPSGELSIVSNARGSSSNLNGWV